MTNRTHDFSEGKPYPPSIYDNYVAINDGVEHNNQEAEEKVDSDNSDFEEVKRERMTRRITPGKENSYKKPNSGSSHPNSSSTDTTEKKSTSQALGGK